jgi:hypothetical protein
VSGAPRASPGFQKADRCDDHADAFAEAKSHRVTRVSSGHAMHRVGRASVRTAGNGRSSPRSTP